MRTFYLLLSMMLLAYASEAQCPGCVINQNCTSNPPEPTLCPAVLPDGTQNQPYDQDVTFFMPANFTVSGVSVTLNQITVNSVTGLPSGVNWQTSASPGNIFYPSQNPPASERGCVKLCGTPGSFGNFNIAVEVTADVTTPFGPLSQNQSFTLPLTILPPAGANIGFSYNPSAGCSPLSVQYTALLGPGPFEIVQYNWNFGNGQTSNDSLPAQVIYANPGTYYPSLNTTYYGYRISSLTFNVTGSDWCGDVEEWSCSFTDPDPYAEITLGSTTTTTAAVSDNSAATWTGLNILLPNPTLSITFWDEDFISVSDNLGTNVFTITGAGSYPFTTSNGNGVLVIDTVATLTVPVSDTLLVLPAPVVPTFSLVGSNPFCANDGVYLVTGGNNGTLQWYLNDTLPLIGSTSDTLYPASSGQYSVMVTSSNGCTSISSDQSLLVYPNPAVPVIVQNGGLLSTSASGSLQWYFNGTLLPGETSNTLAYGDSGTYSVSVTDANNCSSTANLFLGTPSGFFNAGKASGQYIYNEREGCLIWSGSDQLPEALMVIDLSGRILLQAKSGELSKVSIDNQLFGSGLYVVSYTVNGSGKHQRFFKP